MNGTPKNKLRKKQGGFTLIFRQVLRPRAQDRGAQDRVKAQNAFTLIELLIVIGIVAVLGTVVIITLNPAELLKQARDSTRLSDVDTINKALAITQTDALPLGNANTIYVSIADTSATCGNLGLSILPSGWSYACVTSANLRNTNGTGWIPVDFTQSAILSFSALPIDPINTTSTGKYYTYVSGGSWELTAFPESSKYQMGGGKDAASKDGGSYPELYEVGSNLALLPVSRDPSLVGYWKFDEGSGTNAYDASGHGNNGTLSGSPLPTWTTSGKTNAALNFINNNGDGGYVVVGSGDTRLAPQSSNYTVGIWAYYDGGSCSSGGCGLIGTNQSYVPGAKQGYSLMSGWLPFGDGTNLAYGSAPFTIDERVEPRCYRV